MKRIKFLTLFPHCQNVHLTKDVGMVPYMLHRYCGYESTLASYNAQWNSSECEVKGLQLLQIKKYFKNDLLNGCLFLIKNAKNIDILQLYYADKALNIFWSKVFKVFNKKGFVYLKLDADISLLDRFYFYKKGIKGMLYRNYLRQCELITVETLNTSKALTEQWGIKVEYIPNGFYDNECKRKIDYVHKQNYICSVGRLGTYQKNTEELLESFALMADKNKSWNLILVGSVETSLNKYMKKYYVKYPELEKRIEFTGMISNREELNAIYAKSKIFCLTSRWESFSLVYLEALFGGCYIVTSNVGASRDVINEGKCGCFYTKGNAEELARKLYEICNNESLLTKACYTAQQYVYSKFYWPDIVKKLNRMIEFRRN